jgi:hypothetical protein
MRITGRRVGPRYRLRGTFGGWFMRIQIAAIVEVQPEPWRLLRQTAMRVLQFSTAWATRGALR